MNITSVVAALAPPFLAGLLEWRNPINENYINSSVDREMRELREALTELAQDSEHERVSVIFEDVISHYSQGALTAAELAGLAPTLVAVAVSGVAVVSQLHRPVVPIVLYFLTFIIVTIFVLSMLVGRTLNDIATLRPSLLGRSFFLTFIQTVSVVIYLVNGLLFAGAGIVAVSAGCNLSADTSGSGQTQKSDQEPQLTIPQAVCIRLPRMMLTDAM